jgi:hypothetical protein
MSSFLYQADDLFKSVRPELLCPALPRIFYAKLLKALLLHDRPCSLHDFHHIRHVASGVPNALTKYRLRHNRRFLAQPQMRAALQDIT